MKDSQPRILLFDIESSALNGNFGVCFCIGYKWFDDDKVHIITIRNEKTFKTNPIYDKGVIEKFRPVLAQADLMVYHYGQRFDFPFLQTRCFEHKLQPLPEPAQLDTWRIAKDRMKFSSNRLETISRAAETKERKTPLDQKIWRDAAWGHIPSLKDIEHHCRQDILVLEEVYRRLRPFARNHPRLSLLNNERNCPSCGSGKIVKKGLRANTGGIQQQWQCCMCGRWFLTPKTKT